MVPMSNDNYTNAAITYKMNLLFRQIQLDMRHINMGECVSKHHESTSRTVLVLKPCKKHPYHLVHFPATQILLCIYKQGMFPVVAAKGQCS